MTQLPVDTQQAIADDTGVPFVEIADMDWEEIDQRIEQKIGKKLQFHPHLDSRTLPRGSVLLNLGRMILPQDVEKRLKRVQ